MQQDFHQITKATSFSIIAENKVGKSTLLFYLLTALFKEKAIIFTPQESYLFNRKLNALTTQFTQFQNIKDEITPYFLKEEYKTLKQRYGFDFFTQELEKIIKNSENKIIVMHRFGDFFEFQDRYELEEVYKKLLQICTELGKKLILLTNSTSENYLQIQSITDELCEIFIEIKLNEDNERLVHIQDVLHNREYPLLNFKLYNNSLVLDYNHKKELNNKEIVKNVLLCELNPIHDNIIDICKYIFNKPGFRTKHATSLQTILQEVFVSPDIIVVFMQRNKENLKTVQTIKKHLPNSPVIAIVNQDFVRAEDAQTAFAYGVDELFPTTLKLEKLILAFQKAAQNLFYIDAINTLPHYNNHLKNLHEMKKLAKSCVEKSIFFTLFIYDIPSAKQSQHIIKPTREHDYLFYDNKKVYYLAMNTAPKDAQKVKERFADYSLVCIWEPINNTDIEGCFK